MFIALRLLTQPNHIFGSNECVFHQHSDCHRPNASWHGRDVTSNFAYFCNNLKRKIEFKKWTNRSVIIIIIDSPSKSTSPTNFICPVTSSVMRVMPTSIMHAPGLTMSAVTKRGTPVADTIMSAFKQSSFNWAGGVKRWHMVTVASIAHVSLRPSACKSIKIGSPTFFERPITTAFLPNVSMFVRFRSSCTPNAVHGINVFMSKHKRPTFFSLKPSTSLVQLIASHIRRSSTCFGTGNCTSMPSTPSSAFRSLIMSNSSLSLTSVDRRLVSVVMPTSAAAYGNIIWTIIQ